MTEVQKPKDAPTQQPKESMQQTIERVIQDGLVDKKELEELLTKYKEEKDKITAGTKDSLDGLIKESLAGMLKNGLDLDDSIIPLLKANGYTIDDAVINAVVEKSLSKEKKTITVTLDPKDPKKVIEMGLFNDPLNDNISNLSTENMLNMRKEEHISAIVSNERAILTNVDDFIKTIENHPYKGVRESAFEQAIQQLTGSKEKQNIVTHDEKDFAILAKYLGDIVVEAKRKQQETPVQKQKAESGVVVTPIADPIKPEFKDISKPKLTVGNLGELENGALLKVAGKNVNFRDEKNKSLGKIDGDVSVVLDITDRKTGKYKANNMIPVIVGDGKKAYIAEQYLAKKEITPETNKTSTPKAKK